MENAIIEDVKKKHPEMKLFLGKINFINSEKQPVELEFIYRKPTVTDMEMYTKASQKDTFSSQQNLLVSLIVYPERQDIAAAVKDYPTVVANFVDEVISPFFGSAVRSESSPL